MQLFSLPHSRGHRDAGDIPKARERKHAGAEQTALTMNLGGDSSRGTRPRRSEASTFSFQDFPYSIPDLQGTQMTTILLLR